MSIEAMKLALAALKQIDEAMPFPVAKLAQAALREALAEQPAQHRCEFPMCHNEEYQQALAEQITRELYTGQPAQQHIEHCLWARNGNTPCPHVQTAQRKPLTFSKLCDIEYEITHRDGDFSILKFARAIEAAHGIKGDA